MSENKYYLKTEIRDYHHSFSQHKLNIIQKIQTTKPFHHLYTIENRSRSSGALQKRSSRYIKLAFYFIYHQLYAKYQTAR